MDSLQVILESYSFGDAAQKLYGTSSASIYRKIKKILNENGYDESIFKDRNKNRKYEITTKICPVCTEIFETKIGGSNEKETCSIKCANSHRPKRKRQILSKQERKFRTKRKNNDRKKIRNFICEICDKEFERITSNTRKIKCCTKECNVKLHRKIQNKLIEDGLHKGWTSRNIESYPERFFKKVLTDMKINYIFNMPVSKKDLGIESSSFYFLDFFINKNRVKIDLEIDGKQHKISERLSSDVERDRLLSSNSYLVYRIEWNSINNEKGKEMMKNKISEFVEWYNSI